MAKYLVEDASLAAVADAIRSKGGTEDALMFPEDFVSAVDAISVSGSGDTSVEDGIIAKAISGAYANDRVTSIGSYVFRDNPELTSVSFKKVTAVGMYAFINCYALCEIDFPLLVAIETSTFQNCYEIELADFPSCKSVAAQAFRQCNALKALVLRYEQAVVSLANTSALQSTPVAGGTGYIYVPAALIDAYKTATNWSTYAAQFRAIEDYTVDGTVTGAIDWDKINAA